MKYSMNGFNQYLMFQVGLDDRDCRILEWFMDFKQYPGVKTTNENNTKYYWIHYSLVLKEFPTFNIKNTRSISNRFDKYVELGILKKTVKHTQKGPYTYFTDGEKLNSLLYDKNNNYAEEILAFETKGKDLFISKHSELKASVSNSNINSFAEANKNSSPQTNFRSSPETNENSSAIQYYPTTNLNPTTTNCSSKDSTRINKLLDILEHLIIPYFQEHIFPQINTDSSAQSISHTKENSSAKISSHTNINSPAKTNSGTKNNSPTLQKEVSEFSVYKNIISKYYSPNCFSKDFWQKLNKFCISNKIEENQLENYIDFVYKTVISKNPKSEVNYFYKVVTEPSYAALFFQQIKTQEIKKETILHTCKCCNKDFDEAMIYCTTCNFNINDEKNATKLKEYKELYAKQIKDSAEEDENTEFPKFEPTKYKSNKASK